MKIHGTVGNGVINLTYSYENDLTESTYKLRVVFIENEIKYVGIKKVYLNGKEFLTEDVPSFIVKNKIENIVNNVMPVLSRSECGWGSDKMKKAVKYLQNFMNTYDQQSFYEEYSLKTYIEDVLYGLGKSISEDFTCADGFRRFKEEVLVPLLKDQGFIE